jgi:tryptophan synthase alpha chain
MSRRIMAHMVACFPDRAGSLAVARGLAAGGASYLEVQLPFSDPMADGPDIQAACARALDAGFTVDDGLRLVAEIVRAARLPVFVMSYANLLFTRGMERFIRECAEAGAAGLIVPDLPVDCDEGLFRQARARGLSAVPVLSPSMSEERLHRVLSLGTEHLYATLRAGITGSYTEIGAENLRFLARLAEAVPRNGKPARVLAGFGVSSRGQVSALAGQVHAVVVGSALVREAARHPADPGPAVVARMRELAGD